MNRILEGVKVVLCRAGKMGGKRRGDFIQVPHWVVLLWRALHPTNIEVDAAFQWADSIALNAAHGTVLMTSIKQGHRLFYSTTFTILLQRLSTPVLNADQRR
ncbi:hypothetical protein [Pseudomonas fluorescens]|uniref:hypothetical protein n=1 Tax=Pseudomonas fluorescens TaxID=294 RepID=UPI0011175890|nr:hypothetical protein [Pseudomonas fluorescens]